MEPIILKIELSAAPDLLKALNGLSALATAMAAKQSKSDNDKSDLCNKEAVMDRMRELISSGHRKEVSKLLKEFGVTKASDLDPKDYNKFMKQAENIH